MNQGTSCNTGYCPPSGCYTGEDPNYPYYNSSNCYAFDNVDDKYPDSVNYPVGPQDQLPLVESHEYEGANYSTSLYEDSIPQVYDSGLNETARSGINTYSYNPTTSYPNHVQSYQNGQADYTVFELSTPVECNASSSRPIDGYNVVPPCQATIPNDGQFRYPEPRSLNQPNSNNFMKNQVLPDQSYPSYPRESVYNYASVQVSAPSVSEPMYYNQDTSKDANFSVNGQYKCQNNCNTVNPPQADIYSCQNACQVGQGIAPTSYNQNTYYSSHQDYSSQFQVPQKSYHDVQTGVYHQNQEGYYAGPFPEAAQMNWHEQSGCSNQPVCNYSQVANNYNYENPQMQTYYANQVYSYDQQQPQQQPEPVYSYEENYPQTNQQRLQVLSKPIQEYEKADVPKVPDSTLQDHVAVQDQTQPQLVPSANPPGAEEELEEGEEEEESVQPASPCEPTHDYVCSQCDKRFDRPSHLEMHFRTHTGERPFRCGICGRAFTQASNLHRHMRSHKTWPQLLSLGGSISASSEALVKPSRSIMTVARRVHVLSTSSLLNYSTLYSQFECRFCGLRLKGFQKMRSHMVEHRGEKMFQCIVSSCLKTFSGVEEFMEHLGSEHDLSDSKWLYCKKCDRQFESVADLLNHYSTKRNGGVALCGQRKKSGRSRNQSLHKGKTHSTTTQLRCPICRTRRFARYGLLRLHLLNDHAASSVSEAYASRSARLRNSLKPLSPLKAPAQQAPSSQPLTVLPDSSTTFTPSNPAQTASVELPSNPNPPSPPLQLTNVHLIIDKRAIASGGGGGGGLGNIGSSSARKASRHRGGNTQLVCPLCGRIFKKQKFFEDHCVLCRQKQVETERRQRWRENRRQSDGISTADVSENTSEASLPLPPTSRRSRRYQQHIPTSS